MELRVKKLTKVFWYMSEVSHYGTRPSRCPPEAILHYASRDWPTDVTSACRGGAPSYYISPVVTSSLQSRQNTSSSLRARRVVWWDTSLIYQKTLVNFLTLSFLSIFIRYLTMGYSNSRIAKEVPVQTHQTGMFTDPTLKTVWDRLGAVTSNL